MLLSSNGAFCTFFFFFFFLNFGLNQPVSPDMAQFSVIWPEYEPHQRESAEMGKKKKKMRSEEAWSRAGPDSGSGEKEEHPFQITLLC